MENKKVNNFANFYKYCPPFTIFIYSKYSVILIPYHTYPKILTSQFYYIFMSKNYLLRGKKAV